MPRRLAAFLLLSIVSSTVGAQTKPRAESQSEDKPLVTPPRLIRFVEATYPSSEERGPEEAVVELDLVVGKDGRVTEATIARSPRAFAIGTSSS